MRFYPVLMFLVSVNSYAAIPLANCWTKDGSPTGINAEGQLISDGQWIVNVNPKLVSKDELIWLLDSTSSHSLRRFLTIVRPEYIIIGAKAVDDGAHYPNVSPRAEIQQKANAQMSAIAALPAANGLGCNTINQPNL